MNVELTAGYRDTKHVVYGKGERIALPDAEAQSLIDRGGAKRVEPEPSEPELEMKMATPNKMLAPGGKGKPQPDVKLKRG